MSYDRPRLAIWDLNKIGELPEDEQDEIIEEIATALVRAGTTEEELDDLQRLVDHLAEQARQMKRPN